jgi:A/G-specific adenine glycosylase
MAKRKKEVSEESDFEAYNDGSDSDASYSAKTRKKPARIQVAKPTKRRRGTPAEERSVTTTANPHSRGTHVMQSSDKVRTALLGWYQLVHETRGMPWRKAFNPQHSRAERAQRAYEVGSLEHWLELGIVTILARFGYPRSCYNKPR